MVYGVTGMTGRGVGRGIRAAISVVGGVPHIPLAHAEAMTALDQIEMDMRFMVTVGTGTEHCGETAARTVAQVFAEFLGDGDIRKTHGVAVRQNK